jgi:hypothetical protein
MGFPYRYAVGGLLPDFREKGLFCRNLLINIRNFNKINWKKMGNCDMIGVIR